MATIEMWEGRRVEQKRQLVQAMAKALVAIAGVNPENLRIIIRDVPKSNRGRNAILSSNLPPEKPHAGRP